MFNLYKIVKNVLILFFISISFVNISSGEESIIFTDKYVDFYGYSNNLKKGDIIKVFDLDGVLCGKFQVKDDGKYGLMHVYGDDLTSDDDEGPGAGDKLIFLLNDEDIKPKNTNEIIWTNNGDTIRIDL